MSRHVIVLIIASNRNRHPLIKGRSLKRQSILCRPVVYIMESATRCDIHIGNGRYVRVQEWKGDLRVDIREWDKKIPTKKGVSLPLGRWKHFVESVETIDDALNTKYLEFYNNHLGGNVYCTVEGVCVDIRQYWKPADTVIPTRKGICLRADEYKRLKDSIPQIGQTLPELDAFVPCYLQSDHQNQLGMLSCAECNPNDSQNL